MAEKPSCFLDIPDDILIQVLYRLTLKTLANCSCVSKQLQYLISHSITVSNPKVLVCYHLKDSWPKRWLIGSKFPLLNALSIYTINQDTFVESICSPIGESLELVSKFEILSSCNGLLLVRLDANLLVWNPLTKFIRRVLVCDRFKDGRFTAVGGLCNATASEYKVILAMSPMDSDDEGYIMVATCGISIWKYLEFPYNARTVRRGPVFKGYIHWLCCEDDSNAYHIVYFNPFSDKFIEVPTPQSTNLDRTSRKHKEISLGILEGCLCMPRWHEDNVEVLVMKEYGVGKSWITLFTISFSSIHDCRYLGEGYSSKECICYNSMLPLLKTNNDELLVHIPTNEFPLCWLDCNIKAFDDSGNLMGTVPIQEPGLALVEVIVYEESLFSPSSYNWDICNPEMLEPKWYDYLYLDEEAGYRCKKFPRNTRRCHELSSDSELSDLEDCESYDSESWCRKSEARRKKKKHYRKRKHPKLVLCNIDRTTEIITMKSQREKKNSI